MATPVKKIQIARGNETRWIRPAFLHTWTKQGWELVTDDSVTSEDAQAAPEQEELDGQLSLGDGVSGEQETEEEVPGDSDKNDSETGETPGTDLSGDETADQAALEEN